MSKRGSNRRVLFVQATNPGGYPPLIHASLLMADAGWEVTFLSAPIAGNTLALAPHPRVKVHAIRARPSDVMSQVNYASYFLATARLALQLRPDVVYASDPLGAGPGLLAARLARATLIYHEHDSPSPGTLNLSLARLRAAAARSARSIVFPNEERARVVQKELRFPDDRLRIVWNVPRRAELASSSEPAEPPLIVHYHGSITPERLPETVALAVRRFPGRVRLRIAGYEVPSARGYIRQLVGSESGAATNASVEYIGMIPSREELLMEAARAHVGLALMPLASDDLNMRHMIGASNKPFDYMASGLSLLVSDLPEWNKMFVETGFARAVDPASEISIAGALEWFLTHPEQRRAMSARARRKIETDWNYDRAFATLLEPLIDACEPVRDSRIDQKYDSRRPAA